jgi:hypothetical protein
MVHDTICNGKDIQEIIPIKLHSYRESIQKSFQKIEQNEVTSWWSDDWNYLEEKDGWHHFLEVPKYGCYHDTKRAKLVSPKETVIKRIFSIGGKTGWYYLSFLWTVRGMLDRLIGGVGLRRGRKDPLEIFPGDALDFWRVIIADKERCHLLLYAEMKLPGEAWLEFKLKGDTLTQRATFRPKGLLGRVYWWMMIPAHMFIFRGLIKELTK